MIHDFIVVGSGCTGAMAAQTLVEAGMKVTMLDVGVEDKKYALLIPKKDFISIRREEENQNRYLLGDDFESVSWGTVGTGEHLTPPRKHITKLVDKFLPLLSENFFPMESLALGGLGSGWGLGCNVFSKQELEACGLDENKMNEAYRKVASRIGISGAIDDAAPFTSGNLFSLQAVPKMDSNAKNLFGNYQKKKKYLNKNGFFLGRPALALLTEDFDGRKATPYNEMDFYSDRGESAYRPWITINRLKGQNNFQYTPQNLVTHFSEKENLIEVNSINIETGEKIAYQCKKLVLAPGVLGTARIVLRSSAGKNQKLPLLCNPYTYVPCLQRQLLGREMEQKRIGFSQLVMFHDETKNNFDVAQASFYSYRSLLLFRLLKETPLNFVDGRIIMRYLLPALTIAGIHHPAKYSENNFLTLENESSSPAGDRLRVNYEISTQKQTELNKREKKFMNAFRKMKCYPIKKINPGLGSSIHYAGTLPFNKDKYFSLSPEGKLNATKNIFVADGSGFRYLPAKGLTFSLMANAHNVALTALKNE